MLGQWWDRDHLKAKLGLCSGNVRTVLGPFRVMAERREGWIVKEEDRDD